MITYASLADVKARQMAVNTIDDDALLSAARAVSRRVDREMYSKRPVFAPYLEARKVAVASTNVNSYNNTLALNDALLELTAVSVNGSALAVGTTVTGWPDSATPPFRALSLACCSGWYDYSCSGCGYPTATITGVWGIHSDYAQAWSAVDALAAAIVSTTATTLTVADVDGDDEYGIAPRISAGNLLKIDSEYLEVIATNTATNVVTVKRGANGSTAATHLIAAPVSVWQVEDQIRDAVARTAALFYARRGAYNVQTVGDASAQFPPDVLVELRGALQGYAYGD